MLFRSVSNGDPQDPFSKKCAKTESNAPLALRTLAAKKVFSSDRCGWQRDVVERGMECDCSRRDRRSYPNQGLLDIDCCSRRRCLEGSDADLERSPSTGEVDSNDQRPALRHGASRSPGMLRRGAFSPGLRRLAYFAVAQRSEF